jgi:hypothetical protein
MGIPGAMTAVAGATLFGRKPVPVNRVPLAGPSGTSAPLPLATAPVVPAGLAQVRSVRPGELGTPTPASALSSTAWRVPSAANPFSKSDPPLPDAAAKTAPPSATAGRGLSGTPSAFAPATRPAPAMTSPPVSPQAAGRPGSLGAGSPRQPAPAVAFAPGPARHAGNPGAGGVALPQPTSMALPSGRPSPMPSLGQQGSASGLQPPAQAIPALPDRPHAKPAEADPAKAAKPSGKYVPSGATIPR